MYGGTVCIRGTVCVRDTVYDGGKQEALGPTFRGFQSRGEWLGRRWTRRTGWWHMSSVGGSGAADLDWLGREGPCEEVASTHGPRFFIFFMNFVFFF